MGGGVAVAGAASAPTSPAAAIAVAAVSRIIRMIASFGCRERTQYLARGVRRHFSRTHYRGVRWTVVKARIRRKRR
jgi:hypothetical protein